MTQTTTRRPLLTHVFPCFEPGGVQLRTIDIIEALGASFEHRLVTLDGGDASSDELVRHGGFSEWAALPKRGSWASTRELGRILRAWSPDVVLSYDWGAIDAVFARVFGLHRATLLHHEDGFTADEITKLKRRRSWTRRFALRRAACVVVPSEELESIARDDWHVPPEKLRHIANGVDTDRFVPHEDRTSLRRRWSLPERVPLVGTACRLSEIKRVDRLLEAFARLRGPTLPHLVIAGDGPERASLEQRAADLDITRRTHWLGFVERTETLMPALDVFALTSEREIQPRSILEAMACSLPIVATNVGDIGRMLPEEQRSCLVAPHQFERFSSVLAGLLDAPAERSRIGHRNREVVVRRFSRATMQAKFGSLYREALAGAL